MSGTGTLRTTRLLALISNDEIKRAREAGNLFQVLEDRFSGIAQSSEQIEKTLGGLSARIKDALQSTTGAAATGLFEELKLVLTDVNNLLVDSATFKPNPEVVAAFAAIFAALTNIVRAARRLASGVGLERFRRTAEGIAKVIQLAGEVLVGVVSGFTRGFSLIVALVSSLFTLFGGGNVDVAETVSLVTEILVIVFALRAGWQGIVALTKLFNTQLFIANSAGKSLLLTILAIPAALLVGLAAGTSLGNVIAGTGFKTVTVAKAIASVLTNAFKTAVDAAELAFTFIREGFTFLANKTVQKLIEQLAVLADKLGELATAAGFDELGPKLTEFAGDAQIAAAKLAQGATKNVANIKKEFDELVNGTDRFGEGLNDVLARAGEDPTIGQLGANLGKSIKDQLDSVLGLLPGDVDAGVRQAIEAARKAVESQGDLGTAGVAVTPRGEPATDEQLDAVRASQDRAAATALEVAGLERINALNAVRASDDQIALVEAQNQLALLEAQQTALEETNRIEFERNVRRLQGAQSLEEQFQISQEIDGQIAEQSAEEAKLSAEVTAANLKLEQQRLIMEGTATQGIGQALLDFPTKIGTAFEAGLAIASEALDAFSNLVADAIVDAFDPTRDAGFKERLAQL
ncbi:MAG: hypothetical protein AAB295_11300, partial [Chloroflexota bacterium]